MRTTCVQNSAALDPAAAATIARDPSGGVPGAAVGKPVLAQYSPAGYVEQSGVWQCVHLTQKGFSAMYKQLVKRMVP